MGIVILRHTKVVAFVVTP
jgi:hypothetical protein